MVFEGGGEFRERYRDGCGGRTFRYGVRGCSEVILGLRE